MFFFFFCHAFVELHILGFSKAYDENFSRYCCYCSCTVGFIANYQVQSRHTKPKNIRKNTGYNYQQNDRTICETVSFVDGLRWLNKAQPHISKLNWWQKLWCCVLILCLILVILICLVAISFLKIKEVVWTDHVGFAPHLIFFKVINFLDTGFRLFLNDLSPFSRAVLAWLLANPANGEVARRLK